MKKSHVITCPVMVILFTSCIFGQLPRVDHIPTTLEGPRYLAVFFDGTGNNESSHTNIAKLHNLATLQQNPRVSTTYIKGVGAGYKPIGLATGAGIANDVRDAYYYLAKNYKKRMDKILIFGFSRGAFSARILAAMLYVSGLPDLNQIEPSKRKQFVDDVYRAYKHKFQDIHTWLHDITDGLNERRNKVARIYDKYSLKEKYPLSVNVEFMGIWDTVEALGFQDLKQNTGEPNPRYADQLCNVRNVAHGLSIDDNRARVFTPLLLSQRHIIDETCDMPKDFSTTLNEVWFSGAHSDVGGGNSTDISGVSLNWMLDMMEESGISLVPIGSAVYDNYLGETHEGDSGPAAFIYKKVNRSLDKYIQECQYQMFFVVNDKDAKEGNHHFVSSYDANPGEATGTLSRALKIHQSVFDRLCVIPPKKFESKWYKRDPFIGCIECEGNKGRINGRCSNLIKAVSNPRYKPNYSEITYETCDYEACWEAKAKNEPFHKIKSCNYGNTSETSYASERIEVKKLYNTGEDATIMFYADRDEDHTGVYLKKGMNYKVSIETRDIEGWMDCIYKAKVDDGRPIPSPDTPFYKKIIDVLGYPLAHSYKTGYMGLIGQVRGKIYPIGELGMVGGTFIPQDNGELVLRVNEPKFLSKVYKNNHGRVRLKIEVIGVGTTMSDKY